MRIKKPFLETTPCFWCGKTEKDLKKKANHHVYIREYPFGSLPTCQPCWIGYTSPRQKWTVAGDIVTFTSKWLINKITKLSRYEISRENSPLS